MYLEAWGVLKLTRCPVATLGVMRRAIFYQQNI